MVAIAPIQLTAAQHTKLDTKSLKEALAKGLDGSDKEVQEILDRLIADQQKDKKTKLEPALQAMVDMQDAAHQVGAAVGSPPGPKAEGATSTSGTDKNTTSSGASS